MMTAERKFAHRVGRIRPECVAPPCLAAIDGAASPPNEAAVVRVGSHTVTVEGSSGSVTRVVTVAPDDTVVVRPEPAPTPAPAPAPAPTPAPAPAPARALGPAPTPAQDSGGMSPAWFYVGLGATAIAGGLTIASGVDTANQHSTFQTKCGGSSPDPSCARLRSDGQSAQLRTNVALGVTAGLAAVTGVIVFFVRWRTASIALAGPGLAFDACF
jgi:hypothetical protein